MLKCFLLAFTCALLSTDAFAQAKQGVTFFVSDQNATAYDTLANATTDTQTFALSSGRKKLSIHIVGVELSGTAAITFTVEVSNDGTNFTTHPTADTVAFVNTTSGVYQSKAIEINDCGFTHVRIKGVGSGTQSTLWYVKMKWNTLSRMEPVFKRDGSLMYAGIIFKDAWRYGIA